MAALSREDLDTAEWLLTEVRLPLDAETIRGVNSANNVQLYLERYRPGTPTHTQLLRMKQFMETQGIRFPVETSAEVSARKGYK